MLLRCQARELLGIGLHQRQEFLHDPRAAQHRCCAPGGKSCFGSLHRCIYVGRVGVRNATHDFARGRVGYRPGTL